MPVLVAVAAAIVLLGRAAAGAPPAGEEAVAATATVAVQQMPVPQAPLRDEATMVIVGTALIGLAAAVRRAA